MKNKEACVPALPMRTIPKPCRPVAVGLARQGLFRNLTLLLVAGATAGCMATSNSAPRLDATGAARSGGYAVTAQNIDQVRGRALDTVNNSRTAAGLAPVVLDAALSRAADDQSGEMSRQQRAWHFGADGSSPLQRASRAGYPGQVLGELVSETYESEVRTIATWMGRPEQKAILLAPEATHIGLGAFQDPNAKLWWTLMVAR